MAKITITDDEGNTTESDTFVAITMEQEGEMVYARSFSSLRHLGLSGHLIAASAMAEALSHTVKEATENAGADMLFEEIEFNKERKEDDDGENRTS